MSKASVDYTTNKIKAAADCYVLFREYFPDNWDGNVRHNAKCPWHNDTEASLSMRSSDFIACHGGCATNGKVRGYDCFAIVMLATGCSFPESIRILADRYGIAMPDSNGKKPRLSNHNGRREVAAYQYMDADGKLIMETVRYEPKTFGQRRPNPNRSEENPDKWIHNLEGVKLVLYHLPQLLDAPPEVPIILCEGEKDVHSAEALGFVATTMPQGAGKWPGQCERHQIHEPLKDRTVWIFPDFDPDKPNGKGKQGQRHAEAVAAQLYGYAKTVKILSPTDIVVGSDLTDYVQAQPPDTARDVLTKLGEGTPEFNPPREGPEIIACKDLMKTDFPPPRWVIPGFIPWGLSLLAGASKLGKSWLITALGLDAAIGRPALGHFPTHGIPGTILQLCLEDTPRRMQGRFRRLLGDEPAPENLLICCEWKPFDKGGIEDLHGFLERTPDTSLVVIDTWAKFRPKRSRCDDAYEGDYADLGQLHSLTKIYDTSVLVLHHTKKGVSDDPMNNILGSTALQGVADSLFVLERKRGQNTGTLHISGRDIAECQYALKWDDGLWTYVGSTEEVRLSDERREIVEAFRAGGNRPMGATDLAPALGKERSNVQKRIGKLVDQGILESSVVKGKYILKPELMRDNPPAWENECPVEAYGEEIYLDSI